MRQDNRVYYAGFGVRLFAWLVDMALLSAALAFPRAVKWGLAFYSPLSYWTRSVFFRYSRMDIIFYLLTAAYFVATTYCFGATLGKRLLNLRVVSPEDRKPTLWEVLIRETVGRYLSGVILMLGYVGIIMDPEKRGLHDVIADTRVVYVHEEPDVRQRRTGRTVGRTITPTVRTAGPVVAAEPTVPVEPVEAVPAAASTVAGAVPAEAVEAVPAEPVAAEVIAVEPSEIVPVDTPTEEPAEVSTAEVPTEEPSEPVPTETPTAEPTEPVPADAPTEEPAETEQTVENEPEKKEPLTRSE